VKEAMPAIRISITLPYALRLTEGDYRTAQAGEAVRISVPPLEEMAPQTVVAATFQHDEIMDPDEKQRVRAQDADRLLLRANRLLRWYRAVRQRADIAELTRAQASPFRFEVVGPGDPTGWIDPIEHEESGPAPLALTVEQVSEQVRDGLASGSDPNVEVLFLLDAERAREQGRFREAVLFCWSTIDSVFNRKYDSLVDVALAADWAEARTFFKGLDLGLKTKMSAGMRFLANRSLFGEPDNLWARMSDSYTKRNRIIHQGDNATEDDARLAIRVARTIVGIMDGIPVPLAAQTVAPAQGG
jgi:hypothetical protein